ncbi:FKBP-type peptidyl-prolyl cis-trans isomerase [Isoptericola variabilis]|uniref:Peptidyl-prolyl cis-trans isomerase n=1 Tax=Isoptericola variabilis (strain 225) TaxID=743718 RepID=F6FTT7_ISOV2|nr:FKBP-type peptidyl-prolyl cis-trans isomerase [Isoptericola variabilis]AEG44214.1 peptidylprolyl isomerase FKBP-type [Isoptericola variabilis 225]TWH28468.1 peptidylprolyl isomerase [Isoptericola variabilis J7]
MLRRLALTLTAVLVGALALTGCGAVSSVLAEVAPSPAPSQAPVQVAGSSRERPVLDYATPFAVTRPGARTVWSGTGDPVEEGRPMLLHLYAEDGRDRSVIQDTWADAPTWTTMSESALGPNLYETLRGQRAGARVLVLDEDDGVPVVLVVDVLPTRATGSEVEPAAGLPAVSRTADGAPTVSVPADAEPPGDLVIAPLVRGTGPQVRIGDVLTVRFTAVRWSDGSVFDTTWSPGTPPQTVTIGVGQLVEGWDQGLLEQTVGSQVLLVVPPHLGYGGTTSDLADETLVYVVDILDAHRPVVDPPEPSAQEPAESSDNAQG